MNSRYFFNLKEYISLGLIVSLYYIFSFKEEKMVFEYSREVLLDLWKR